MRLLLFFCSTVLASVWSCTPKAPVEESPATPTTVTAPKPDEKLSPCPKFVDAQYPGRVEDNYVIYRDYLKTAQITKAYNLWKTVYEVAPAADGRRNTVITDGIYFMEYFASQTTDEALQKAYQDTVFMLYDKIEECYPEGGYVPARKGFDCFYKYQNRCTKQDIYAYFKQAIAIDGEKAPDFIINPLTATVVDLHEAGDISTEEAREIVDFILQRIKDGQASAKTKEERERWAIIADYVPQRLAYFEGVPGFFDCEYFKNRYEPEIEDAIGDYTRLTQLAGYLRFGQCPDTDPIMQRLITEANKVKPEPIVRGCNPFDMLRDGQYSEAVKCLEERYEATDDEGKKAQFALIAAKVYYGNLKRYSTARQWANKALSHKSGWGEPLILIGKLYASSGPLCGPGTGFDSQRVVWPAIDKWNAAKRIDPSVAAEANKLIGKYSAFMPSKEDLFQRGITVGSTYTVPCWIGESTVVRAAP